ncbi:myotrophin-like [Xenia sp. Carnegie-2017]|uniref:myotrophin-like n=1 Tax=Xenia sp. Carnegie-2017 TaxID=2897299 RepID=UPI001F046986|nr:myotrophin-like [Xenia sp. Carnegie-2017]
MISLQTLHAICQYNNDFGLSFLNRRIRTLRLYQYEPKMGEELLWAVKNGDLDKVRELVERKGCSVNSELMNGRNPLHFAADYGQLEVLKYLISKGANVNLPDKHGITPLLAAIYEEHLSCVKLLLSKGAKSDGKTPSGESYKDSAESQEIKDLL